MRIDHAAVYPAARRAMLEVEKAVHAGGVDPLLLELVKIRASQLNGCAHCLEMHTKDARALGETDDRMHLLAAWQEAESVFSARERAALAWCETLTLLPQTGAPDDVYDRLAALFGPQEIVVLTLAIVAINGWNRLAVALRADVGHYTPAAHVPARAADGRRS